MGEKERIERCGGSVPPGPGPARVNGDLSVSRGFGDSAHKTNTKHHPSGTEDPKDRQVTVDPEVVYYVCEGSDFLLLVCDGVSEGDYPNKEVVKTVADCLKKDPDPAAAARKVCELAIEKKSKDNISCMVVLLSAPATEVKKTEFISGPLMDIDNENWRKAYVDMCERGNTTLVDAVDQRYEWLQQKLKERESGNDDDMHDIVKEAEKFGT